jgi:hypothetical protein
MAIRARININAPQNIPMRLARSRSQDSFQ